jgi:hypothetical protein
MRFRELERIILDDGWVLSDIRGDIPLRVVILFLNRLD